jgi:hypothetical protein
MYSVTYGEIARTISFVAAVAFAIVAITIVRVKLASHPRPVQR